MPETASCVLRPGRTLFKRSTMLYGHFIEHFHRQIYGGIYDPGNPLSDADGFREAVRLSEGPWQALEKAGPEFTLEPHSANVIQLR